MDNSIGLTRQLVLLISTFVCASCTSLCDSPIAQQKLPQPCSADWLQLVDDKFITADHQGHGPDLGSLEWRSVIEFRLNIRGEKQVPPLGSVQWCDFINIHYIKSTL